MLRAGTVHAGVREALSGLGFDMDRYHQESFRAPAQTQADVPVHDDVVPAQQAEAQIHFAKSDKRAACQQTETILAVTRAAGLNIPSGCTFGVCGTCKVRKLSGEVHMVHNGGISGDDIAAGYILACCSNPIGDITIDI